jgi:ATP-dependent exoDNAse (exonuclease V) beta subunit
VILDGEWVSGVFDCVVFAAEGTATILDFKTNRLSRADEERMQVAASAYAGQMSDYRKALKMLLQDRDTMGVESGLVFTDSARILPVG